MSIFENVKDFNELFTELIDDWVDRERERAIEENRPRPKREDLLADLARKLGYGNGNGDDNNRSLAKAIYRFQSGEVPFPFTKVEIFCDSIGNNALVQFLGFKRGLIMLPQIKAEDLEELAGEDVFKYMVSTADKSISFIKKLIETYEEQPSLENLQKIDHLRQNAIISMEKVVYVIKEIIKSAIKPGHQGCIWFKEGIPTKPRKTRKRKK